MTQLVLSLFPGIGLMDRAFEEEGFCVVRGPDLLWGGDIHSFHPPASKFDGVIGGPPCQAFSRLRHLVEANGYRLAPNLIPEFERVVGEALPRWFLMENVPEAPVPLVTRRSHSYGTQSQLVRDVWVGGETSRLRLFTFGYGDAWCDPPRFQIETLALHRPDPARAVTCDTRQVPVAIGGNGKRKVQGGRAPHCGARESIEQMLALQGLPADFFGEDSPFTSAGKKLMVGNGVPLPMGRAVAKAVKRALNLSTHPEPGDREGPAARIESFS